MNRLFQIKFTIVSFGVKSKHRMAYPVSIALGIVFLLAFIFLIAIYVYIDINLNKKREVEDMKIYLHKNFKSLDNFQRISCGLIPQEIKPQMKIEKEQPMKIYVHGQVYYAKVKA